MEGGHGLGIPASSATAAEFAKDASASSLPVPPASSVPLNEIEDLDGAPPGSCTSLIFVGSTNDEEEDDDGAEVEESLKRDGSSDEDDDDRLEPQEFLLPSERDPSIEGVSSDAQARLEAFLEAAGFSDGEAMSDPERKLTSTVCSALREACAAINRMRDPQRQPNKETKNDPLEEGDSLLAQACSSGHLELVRVLLSMGAYVDDRGSKGDLTPLMEAASKGHLEIVRLLIRHGADVNAQSVSGNCPLMYSCANGHEEVVHELLQAGANIEGNNENGQTPLIVPASAGHVGVEKK